MSTPPEWSTPLAHPALLRDDVHVWRVVASPTMDSLQNAEACLSPDEATRASRFHFERDRRRFVSHRVALRTLLGAYTGIPPSDIEFIYSEFGKPALANRHATGLSFNVSHSGELGLIAVAVGRRVGVDLELVQPPRDMLDLAARVFAPAEAGALRVLPVDRQPDAFFACWTRKEAFVKAIGAGLSYDLHSFEVSLAEHAPRNLLVAHRNPDELERWHVQTLNASPGFAAALAAEGQWTARCWSWTR